MLQVLLLHSAVFTDTHMCRDSVTYWNAARHCTLATGPQQLRTCFTELLYFPTHLTLLALVCQLKALLPVLTKGNSLLRFA